jgi:Tol biopolymer transport system component
MPSSATITPDGNVFVYNELEGDTARMFVQQTGQASRTEIASSTSLLYASNTFSPDGQSIFFVAVDKKANVASLYRIPTMGGSPVKILDEIHGPPSLSPDGKEMTFVRRNPMTGATALLIASTDGKSERILMEKATPKVLLPTPAWSPDGKLIAYADRDTYDGQTLGTHRIHLLNIATGKSTPLSSENWDIAFRLIWSPDGRGIFFIGTRFGDGYSTRRDQVYFVSYPEGVSRRLTNEGNRHEPNSLGVTKKGDIISVSSNRSSQIWAMDANGNASSAVQITKGTSDGRAGISFLPDGRFGYVTRNADEIQIMLANADGSGAKQVATGFPFLEELRADPQGRFLVFSTLEDGKGRMFRIDLDGGNLKQLTFGDGSSIDSSVSPDGKYLAYTSQVDGNDPMSSTIMRVPVEGGEPVLLKKGCFIPTYSPDGSMLTCISTVKPEVVVMSSSDGATFDSHPIPLSALWNFGWGWLADGSGLVFVDTQKGASNLWVQPRDGGKPRQITNFTSGIIHRYACSPDGSKIYLARGYPTQDAFLIKNFR